jgi:hypothetical protein
MRHGRRTAATLASRLGNFRNFSLHQQTNVACQFAQGPRQDSTGADQSRQAVTMGMPWRVGTGQSKLMRQAASYIESILSKRCERSDSTTELHHESIGEGLSQSRPAAVNGCQPPRSFQAKGNRRRGLEESSSQHDCVLMLL